jgi:energy-coupling factor transporter ATP-binding protein EcfA2
MATSPPRNAPTRARQRLGVPVVPWSRFSRQLDYRQGEHVSMIGTTGSGKTTLGVTLLPLRKHRLIICVKPRDSLMRKIAREEQYHVTSVWPPHKDSERLILWPPNRGRRNLDEQADAIGRCLDDLYSEGAWCVYIDELEWVTNDLGLEDHAKVIWQHGRSLKLSLISGSQRPRHVPMLAYDQSTHLFLWQNSDRYNRRRMSEISGFDGELAASVIAQLPKHVFLYVNTRDNMLTVSKTPPRG